jgi:hypothetical protein
MPKKPELRRVRFVEDRPSEEERSWETGIVVVDEEWKKVKLFLRCFLLAGFSAMVLIKAVSMVSLPHDDAVRLLQGRQRQN